MNQQNTIPKYDYYIDYFQGIEVRIKKDKVTQQIYYSSDIANILGFSKHQEMIQSNKGGFSQTSSWLYMNTGLIIEDL
jgi:TATA-box binding protein (TBP) (component of TFIID and TFIIIB)